MEEIEVRFSFDGASEPTADELADLFTFLLGERPPDCGIMPSDPQYPQEKAA